MFEVVAEVLNMRTLELEEIAEIGEMKTLGVIRDTSDVKMLDIAQRTLDVDEQMLEMGPQGPRKDNPVDGCNDIASSLRMRLLDAQGITSNINTWFRFASRMTLFDFDTWRIDVRKFMVEMRMLDA